MKRNCVGVPSRLIIALLALVSLLGTVFVDRSMALAEQPANIQFAEGSQIVGGNVLPPPNNFRVKASNGYSVLVAGLTSKKSNVDWVAIYVTRRNEGTIYKVPAQITPTYIQADLGNLGEVAMEFHPDHHEQMWPSKCGEPSVTESGYYSGVFDFHGEDGYTTVRAITANPNLSTLLNLYCPGASGFTGIPSLPGAELDARSSMGNSSVKIMITKNHRRRRAHFEASATERCQGITITRFINSIAAPRAFAYEQALDRAVVRASRPFAGVGWFHRESRVSNRWTGDLTVNLPGRTKVNLTGRRFDASLTHALWKWN